MSCSLAFVGTVVDGERRCIAGAIITELKNNNMPLENGLKELCKIFEAGMLHTTMFFVQLLTIDNM